MKQKIINVCSYTELKEKAKEKASQKIREIIIDDNFYFLEEELKNKLSDNYNIICNDLYYSLGCCQGDGVCFTLKNMLSYALMNEAKRTGNIEKLNAFEKYIMRNCTKQEINTILYYLNCGYNMEIIKTSHHYSHAGTCSIDYEYFYSSDSSIFCDYVNAILERIIDPLYSLYLDICGELEKIGYKCYDVEETDIEEYAESNDMDFLENGDIY